MRLPGVDCRASLAHRQIAAAFSRHGTARTRAVDQAAATAKSLASGHFSVPEHLV
jgi:hypothetical protein